MSVSLYFGLPGCGKTTMLAKLAYDGLNPNPFKKLVYKLFKKPLYKNVYGNVRLSIPGYTYIDNECIGQYELTDALILIDEATLFAHNRSYKTFPTYLLDFFVQHRHANVCICLFSQSWESLDKRIREITDRVYYIYKTPISGKCISNMYRIPYGIIIPDKNAGDKYGQIIQGYCKPHFLIRLFSPKLHRKKYYKYFDSWERTPLPPLPEQYKPYEL